MRASLGPCWRRFSSSARPWEGAAGTSCGPAESCGGGFAGVAALSPGDCEETSLSRGRRRGGPHQCRGDPGTRLGLSGGRRGGAVFAGPVGCRKCLLRCHDHRGGKGARRVTLKAPRFWKCWGAGVGGRPGRLFAERTQEGPSVLASTPRRCCSSAPFFKVMGKISVNAATNSEP